jgi:hypothetical protein
MKAVPPLLVTDEAPKVHSATEKEHSAWPAFAAVCIYDVNARNRIFLYKG